MVDDLVVALTGASGSALGVRLVEVLLRAGRRVHLTISPAAGPLMVSSELLRKGVRNPPRMAVNSVNHHPMLAPTTR